MSSEKPAPPTVEDLKAEAQAAIDSKDHSNDQFLAVYPADANFSTNQRNEAMAYIHKNPKAIVIDRDTGEVVTLKLRQLGRYLCTSPCSFSPRTADFHTDDRSEALRHASNPDHRVVDRIQGVPMDHPLSGKELVARNEQ